MNKKICDPDTRELLRSQGVKEKEIERIYKEYVHSQVSVRLFEIAWAFQDEDYDSVLKHLSFSPAGDGYGSDNHFINFGSIVDENYLDLYGVIKELNKKEVFEYEKR